jgi:hypothetical protein
MGTLVTVSMLILSSCPNPGGGAGGIGSSTSRIVGHARYNGQSDHSGITVSAGRTD